MRNSIKLALAALLAAGALQGCSSIPFHDPEALAEIPVTPAALPTKVVPYPVIDDALQCIADTKALRGVTFQVGAFADSTGKINQVAVGATGNFMPQGGSATYITYAIRKAGGQVVSTYFGGPAKAAGASYAVNGVFNSLDFSQPISADVRIVGIGPTAAVGYAQLTLSIQLDRASSRLNRQMSMIQRPVRYSQVGAGSGRDWGGTLVTGNIALQNQERLQLEALNGPIALGVADVLLKEFPVAARKCGYILKPLLTAS